MDLGLKDFAVLSNGDRTPAPQCFRRKERKLARAQRVLSRRQKRSNRRKKAKKLVAKIHQKVVNLRNDFLHKFTTRLVDEYEGICIEDPNVKGLARTKLAKSFHDASCGEFRRQLEYKSVWNRRHLSVTGRFYPSTKTCHGCQYVNYDLTLDGRTWACPGCGAVVDRDFNAALNLREEGLKLIPVAAGHAETLNARGEDVRP